MAKAARSILPWGIPPGLCLLLAALPVAAEPAMTIVACAPGHPGTTEQARPAMEAFADGAARAAGWKAGRLRAEYRERLEDGLRRFEQPDAALAMVPLPFYLEYRRRFALEPLLEVVPVGGEEELWQLVAKRGAARGAGALDGWEIVGTPGYSARFVRNVALAGWDALPPDLPVRFTPRVLGALRDASRGEPVVVLLDRAQSEALPALPYAGELETLVRSGPQVSSLLCRVEGRIDPGDAARLAAALEGLHTTEAGRELLAALRLARFRPVRRDLLARAERAFDSGPPGPDP